MRGNLLGEKEVILSFDDGPNTHSSPILLDTLKQHNIQAIFFHVGVNIRNNMHLLNIFFPEPAIFDEAVLALSQLSKNFKEIQRLSFNRLSLLQRLSFNRLS